MAAVADRSHLSAMDANTVDANAATEAPCKQPASHPSTKAPEAFVFACPGCGATLQAALQAEITSVQCDSCRDVFDVQMPPRDAPPIAPPPRAPPPAATGGGPAVGQQRNRPEQLDSTATELESSLMTCAHHREQIEQMLAADPHNTVLLGVRDQLTTGMRQLADTQEMVLRARTTKRGREPEGGLSGLASAAGLVENDRVVYTGVPKMPSSRKNKPQRCSVCGGIGHKSRTCQRATGLPSPTSREHGVLPNTYPMPAGMQGYHLAPQYISTGMPNAPMPGSMAAYAPAMVPQMRQAPLSVMGTASAPAPPAAAPATSWSPTQVPAFASAPAPVNAMSSWPPAQEPAPAPSGAPAACAP